MNFLSVMKGKQWRIALALAGMLGMSMMCCRAIAQETATEEAATEEAAAAPAETPAAPTLEEVNAKADAAALAGNNAWMLTSSALVLFMTAPGLAMFYGGLVRKKNVLSVIMQCLFLMAMMTVIWGLYGYSLAFGDPDSTALKPTSATATFCS